ncbi:MAG TPA: hypothetical protein VIM62_06560 [Acidobacteriaceae bacterium]
MSDFIVRFHGLKLSEEHAERVQAAIQKAVTAEISASSLASYTPNPDDPGSGGGGNIIYLPNHIWRGIIYMPAAVLRNEANTLSAGLSVVQNQRQV